MLSNTDDEEPCCVSNGYMTCLFFLFFSFLSGPLSLMWTLWLQHHVSDFLILLVWSV